jgi:hypothetical protein
MRNPGGPTAFDLGEVRSRGGASSIRTPPVEEPPVCRAGESSCPVEPPARRPLARPLLAALAGLSRSPSALRSTASSATSSPGTTGSAGSASRLPRSPCWRCRDLAAREIAGLLRLRRINRIHEQAVEAATPTTATAARAVVREIVALYRRRPETARGRAALARQRGEIIDGRDLIGLAETELLLPFDESARRMVLSSAKRVALVTAISPRALVDLLFVGSKSCA